MEVMLPPGFEPEPQPLRCEAGALLHCRLVGNVDLHDEPPVEILQSGQHAVEVDAAASWLCPDVVGTDLVVVLTFVMAFDGDFPTIVLDMDRTHPASMALKKCPKVSTCPTQMTRIRADQKGVGPDTVEHEFGLGHSFDLRTDMGMQAGDNAFCGHGGGGLAQPVGDACKGSFITTDTDGGRREPLWVYAELFGYENAIEAKNGVIGGGSTRCIDRLGESVGIREASLEIARCRREAVVLEQARVCGGGATSRDFSMNAVIASPVDDREDLRKRRSKLGLPAL